MNPGDNDLAERVLDLVRTARGAAEAEVMVERQDHALTRFANSAIHQNVAASTTTVRLRLHTDGRTLGGVTTRTEPDGLRELVERTVRAVALCPPDPGWPGLTPPQPAEPNAPVDPDTAYAPPAARADRVRDFIAATGGLSAAGYCSTLRWSAVFANSAGQHVRAETAEAGMDAIARVRGGDGAGADGVARLAAARLAEIDGAVLGARAAAKARAGANPIALAPGRYEIVLEPTAVFDLLQRLAIYGFNGKAVNERRSCVELGAALFDPAISIVDNPGDPSGAGLPFDLEGTVRRPLTLVERGVVTAVSFDRRSAAQAGTASTGHAMPVGPSAGAVASNLHLLPAGADGPALTSPPPTTPAPAEVDGPAADAAVADLVGQVPRGLLVTDNWYTRVLDPRTLVVTGLTRNGVWLIENGQLTAPVQNLRFTQSYPQALAPGAVLGVGTHSVALSGGWDPVTYRVPALRLASWNYTGNASG